MQTFTGEEYLKIDIANNFGLDKKTWYERIRWFDQNEHQLISLVPQAETPALFYAGVKAWRDHKAGRPIGYMISLDATSSGLQLLAALTGDSFAAQLCNVIDTGDREDAYQQIYKHMLGIVGESAKISKDDVKQAVMTALYSSKAVPKRVFGEGALLDVFYNTVGSLAPAAWELNETMVQLWDPSAYEHSWILPDNFHVHVKVMAQVRDTVHFLNKPYDVFYKVNTPTKEGRSLGANTIHSIDGMIVREMSRRCDYEPKKVDAIRALIGKPTLGFRSDRAKDSMAITLWDRYCESGYLSARILDYLDAENMGFVDRNAIKELIDSLPAKPFKVVSIHDCFRCHPSYGNDLRQQYNLQLQLISKSEMLSSIISQLVGRRVPIGKLNPQMWTSVINANYSLS